MQVSSNGAPLREVLQEMASSLKFHLHYRSNENPPVRLEGRHGTFELVQLLSTQANLAVRYRQHAACKGQLEIASIWVLSRENGAAAVRPPHAPAPAPVGGPGATPGGASMPPEAIGPGHEEYLRAHDLLPQPKP